MSSRDGVDEVKLEEVGAKRPVPSYDKVVQGRSADSLSRLRSLEVDSLQGVRGESTVPSVHGFRKINSK